MAIIMHGVKRQCAKEDGNIKNKPLQAGQDLPAGAMVEAGAALGSW